MLYICIIKIETFKSFNFLIAGQAYIKCDRIVDACLNILRSAHLARAFGDAYLNLLYKHVLCCEHYLGYITPANWEGKR